uniref:Family with sequence similarity 171 member B n=1 Tax=Mola mola TaxID=94237 RepID=A0A3Q3VV04_MOLML
MNKSPNPVFNQMMSSPMLRLTFPLLSLLTEQSSSRKELILGEDCNYRTTRLVVGRTLSLHASTPVPQHSSTLSYAFNLKVQVNDVLTHQQLSQAVVQVYINYTRTQTLLTREDGVVLIDVPYQAGVPIIVLASKEGYISTLLHYKSNRFPIFSFVTMSLLGLNQGNIWLFEDSVLITAKTSACFSLFEDASLQPAVQFPKSVLNLTDSSSVTAVKAFLTVPKLQSQEGNFLNTLGIISSKSGSLIVDLSPVAAVSVQLFSGDMELDVRGPIRISLSLPDSCGLQISSVVPAWFFNQTTGGWMRKGLGLVESVEEKLMWTFTAPHLGYWIAAPLTSTRDTKPELSCSVSLTCDSSSQMFYLICRSSPGEAETKRVLSVMRKDQSDSTYEDEILEVSSGNASLECNGLEFSSDLNDLTCLHGQIVPASLTENLFFYNQPVAILHTPAFFHLEELEKSKSANPSWAGSADNAASEPLSKDSFTQTQTAPNVASAAQNQAEKAEFPKVSQEVSSTNTSKAPFGLPESASVPGTLHKIRGSRHSVHALNELSEIPSLQPRAWFVSLEGKPAAEIHYAVSEQHRRRRPAESRETSMDSGVDMSELNQTPGRRAVMLERNVTFVRSTSSCKLTPAQLSIAQKLNNTQAWKKCDYDKGQNGSLVPPKNHHSWQVSSRHTQFLLHI